MHPLSLKPTDFYQKEQDWFWHEAFLTFIHPLHFLVVTRQKLPPLRIYTVAKVKVQLTCASSNFLWDLFALPIFATQFCPHSLQQLHFYHYISSANSTSHPVCLQS